MRKALSGILTSLLFSASLVGSSSTVDADEYVRGDSSKQGTDIQPHERSDREVMNPKTPSNSPEKVNPPREQATGDADSYRQPSQRPYRFGSGTSSDFDRSGR